MSPLLVLEAKFGDELPYIGALDGGFVFRGVGVPFLNRQVCDTQAEGAPTITNGRSLCTIHHRAYDQDLVGVSPDYDVQVARRLLDDDGHPDRERLAARFERFHERG
jgi:hypothetical protein